MGLKMVNVIYKGRTNSLYSKDGETWYEDPSHKIPADKNKIRHDDGGAFQVLLGGIIIIILLAIKFFP